MDFPDSAIQHVLGMADQHLDNYILPGLTSSLLENGKVRLFTMSRQQNAAITPHSHRFDFQCLVLRGQVHNILWEQTEDEADLFAATTLTYEFEPGRYTLGDHKVARYKSTSTRYEPGDWYGQTYDQIHSIVFSHDALVLFFEGQMLTKEAVILEPYVGGKVLRTFKVEPWMFSSSRDLAA